MSTAALLRVRRSRLNQRLAYVAATWRSISAREWTIALSIGAFSAFIGVLMGMELLTRLEEGRVVLLHEAAWLMITSVVGLLAWALADRAPSTGADPLRQRTRRLGAALAIGTLIAAYALPLLVYEVIGVPMPAKEFAIDGKQRPRPPLWVERTNATVWTLIFGGLAFGLIEAHRRRRMAADALALLQQQREALARRALQARLAAMQAHVEPQFLFDSLVEIDALYQRDGAQAASMLDRLITYLRVALPQLRDSGSSARAEADLVAAYLSVVAARHGGVPRVQVLVEPDAAGARFSPMLLLPLVQRAVHAAAGDARRLPASVQLAMGLQEARLVARLRIEAPGQCDNDEELERLRERLAALYGGRASLECSEAGPASEFILRLPCEAADGTDSGRR